MPSPARVARPPAATFEVYMLLKDRKRLARLIEIQEVSKRQVALAAGWKSHSYLLRLLSGEARTVEPEPAMRIATFLGVDIYDLFVAKVTTKGGQNDQPSARKAAA